MEEVSIDNIICIPKNDSYKRFLIGEKGEKELLAIGLNPSSANENTLDPTSKNIKTIAKNNGFDGWWIVNLYPIRTSNPKNLPKRVNKIMNLKNIEFINEILISPHYNFSSILCCWGNFVNKRSYLSKNSLRLFINVDKLGYNCKSLGLTKEECPYHPAPMTINRFFKGVKNIRLIDYKSINNKFKS